MCNSKCRADEDWTRGDVVDSLVELLKSKGVKRFVHFHTDHWEPYTGNWSVWGDESSENAEAILKFIEETTNHPYFDKMTLFYNHPVNTNQMEKLEEKTGDLIGFSPARPKFWERYAHAIKKCATETKHEFQVHIHHEGITAGEYFKYGHLPWPEGHNSPEIQSNRFERYLQETLADIRETTGLELATWHFLHGVWALNASDTTVCCITDEIEILIRNGCIGDFSMPAGRPWVNSTTNSPHTVVPNNAPKGYDEPEADVTLIGSEIGSMGNRFLIWNQEIPYGHCSIDLDGSDEIIAALEDWRGTLSIWIENSPIIGDTAFVKTHAHTMNRCFWGEGSERPYNSPEVLRIFQNLEEVCEKSSVEFDKWTVEEVISHIVSTDQQLSESFSRELSTMHSRTSVNQALIKIGKRRLKSLGLEKSGLYNYYKVKVEQGRFFNDDDEAIIEIISHNFDRSARILEIAAGCGQVSFALERSGFEGVEMCEYDPNRCDFAEEVKFDIGSNMQIHKGDYREIELTGYQCIFVMNAMSSTLGVQDYELLSSTILNGTEVILRYGKYGKDNRIFEELDSNDQIKRENYEDIVRYSSK